MSEARILCIPNFSEGRDEATIQAIADAAARAGVCIHHCSWDYDHHRMVLAFSGTPAQVKRAILASGAVAVERIDLNRHRGAHPRIGAVDVVPFVPLRGLTREEAVAFSHQVARSFARRLRVPVYLYEHSAREGRIRDLPTLRKGGFEGWIGKRLTGVRTPDYGPKRLHATAGATVMGVRDPLIAFNLNLQPPDPAIAQQIARQIRRERTRNPDLHGVRALGLWLPSRQVAQVALNLTQTEQTDLFRVAEAVREMARALGAEIADTELIGVISAEDAARALQSALRAHQIEARQIV
ncbi:MAG: glutamate formimidoyltransferase [Fimbriimonadales bacterium]